MRRLGVVLALVCTVVAVGAVPTSPSGARPARRAEPPAIAPTVTLAPFAPRTPLTKVVAPRPWYIRSGPATRPRIALTIDDLFGAGAVDQMDRVLDTAREKNVKFTFFPTGSALESHLAAGRQNVWQRVLGEGHEIGNHTFSHTNMTRQADDDIRAELQRTADALGRVLGPTPYAMRLMRPPGGAGGFVAGGDPRIMGVLRSVGYSMTMWTIDANGTAGNAAYAAKILGNVRNGSIVLFHFTEFAPDGFAALVDELRARGFEMVTVSALVEP